MFLLFNYQYNLFKKKARYAGLLMAIERREG